VFDEHEPALASVWIRREWVRKGDSENSRKVALAFERVG
jgi:hypothetical protein